MPRGCEAPVLKAMALTIDQNRHDAREALFADAA
jgi:hypothetical protein